MRATISGLSAVLLTLGLSAAAEAWWFHQSSPAVNAFSPGHCCPCWVGGGYTGPYGNWPPACEPFQGFASPASAAGAAGGFSGGAGGFFTQPFARSPRDYFMVDP
jgi:hypothetical protein